MNNFRIYGNDSSKELITKMISKGREPHSLIIHGEKGLGKKKLASWVAAALLCEEGGGVPCGKCKSCRMISEGAHPDVMSPKYGAKGNYMVDDIRPIVSDAVIAPTESRMKVYIIPDLDRSVVTSVQIQNILLKLIEEPPEHTAVILTASGRETFLPTILSRVISIGAVPVTDAESAEYLEIYEGADPVSTAEAVSAGRGNIGRCIEYLNGGLFKNGVTAARSLARAFISRNEYQMLLALEQAEGSRPLLRECLCLFSEIVRDSLRIKLEGESAVTAGCDEDSAKHLSASMTSERALSLYDTLCSYITGIDSNSNTALTINSLCAQLC